MTSFDLGPDQEDRPVPAWNPYKLSRRELEVAALIGQGMTSRRAGELLSISYKTVQTHRAHIMTKVGARNGAHLSFIIGSLTRMQPARPDIVYLEDFRDAFGPTAHSVANDLVVATYLK